MVQKPEIRTDRMGHKAWIKALPLAASNLWFPILVLRGELGSISIRDSTNWQKRFQRHKIIILICCFSSATTHILWKDLLEPVTQVCEIAFVTQAVCDMLTSLRSRAKHVAYILSGDFNIDPHYPAYHLLKDGQLSEKQFSILQTVDYLRFPADIEKPPQVP